MFVSIRNAFHDKYPRQFWVIVFGRMVSIIGSSMIWPFTMIYVSETLNLPLTTAAGLLSLRAIAALISSVISGSITDALGRKWVMVIGLFVYGSTYIMMIFATSYLAFAIVLILGGIFDPLYRIGADAMLADLIEPEKRIEAYSLTRIAQNVGVALGPMIGGFLVTKSYAIAFSLAAAGILFFSILLIFSTKETLVEKKDLLTSLSPKQLFNGYKIILSDKLFIRFTLLVIVVSVATSLTWTLLPVYLKDNFGISESLYGFLPMTNASMVIFLQLIVTRWAKKLRPLVSICIGGLTYGLVMLGFGFANAFWMFFVGFVIWTLGEMMFAPTITTYAANLAPEDMRGRYMSIFSLYWAIASGIGPLMGGILNDSIGPKAIWFGGALFPIIGALGFLLLRRHEVGDKRLILSQETE